MALALLPTVKNTLSGVCLSFPVAGTASIIRVVKTVQSLMIATEWRINMSKKCVCGNEMTREDWKHEWGLSSLWTKAAYSTTPDVHRLHVP